MGFLGFWHHNCTLADSMGNNGIEHGSLSHAAQTAHDRRTDKGQSVRERFQRFAHRISVAAGSPWAFLIAAAIVLLWAASGPIFKFGDTWQLVINTSTTIVTFLMVFLIQNTQNRDAKAIHLKLDELIRSKRGARNALVDLEDCTEEELDAIEQEFKRLRERASHKTPTQHKQSDLQQLR